MKENTYTVRVVADENGQTCTYIYTTSAKNGFDAMDKVGFMFKIQYKTSPMQMFCTKA